jgi:hypothetical protein
MADYLLQVKGTQSDGRPWSTGRHITSATAMATVLANWQAAWIAAWTDSLHGLQTHYVTGTTIDSFVIKRLDASLRQVSVLASPSSHAGTDAGDSLPGSVSVVAAWSSSTAIGRTARGFQALPAPAESASLKDKLTAGALTDFSDGMNAIKTAMTTDGSTFFLAPLVATLHGIAPFTKTVIDVVRVRDRLGSVVERAEKVAATYL